MQAYKLATLNINRIESDVKLQCLKDYLYAADVDIVMLQEVVTPKIAKIPGYDAIINIGNESGTAVLYREGIPCRGTNLLDTGRGISIQLHDLHLINVYAPTGSIGKRRRSDFFASDIVNLLPNARSNLIIGGDFNCVLRKEDQTPNFNACGELEVLINELSLVDSWAYFHPQSLRYTYVTRDSASRLDRLYINRGYVPNVTDCEFWPVNFSDHVAYHITFRHVKQKTFLGRGTWQLNNSLLQDNRLKQEIESTWTQCLRSQARYPTRISWWVQYAKPKLRKCLISYARNQAYWRKRTSEYYFFCLRDLYNNPSELTHNLLAIKRIKAKITDLTRRSLEGKRIRSRISDNVAQERASLFHVVREIRRGKQKIINHLTDERGVVHEEQSDIKRYVERYFTDLYAAQNVDFDAGEELLSNVPTTLNPADNEELLEHITQEELESTIKAAPRGKAAGPDGLPIEFYSWAWNIIGADMTIMYNELLTDTTFPPSFTEGLVVLVPKTSQRDKLQDFRPLTLLNADFKLFTRVLHTRLKPLMPKVVGAYQTSVSTGRSMLNTLCEYRDIIHLSWICKCQLALVFLDFNKAFDRVSHEFLMRTMRKMGFSDTFLQIIRQCICGTFSKVKINGQFTGPIPINKSVRQGCPLSTTLYAMAVEPLLRTLYMTLEGLRVFNVKTVCQAYADDVSVLINTDEEMDHLRRILSKYTRSSGAQLNDKKSQIMHIGPCGGRFNTTWLQATTERLQLGMYLMSNPRDMITRNWLYKLNAIRGMLRENNVRALDRLQKVLFINTYILSKLHHIAAVIPIKPDIAYKILAVACWYVWKRNIFKVSFNTSTLERHKGGLGIKDVQSLCTALFLNRASKIMYSHQPGITRHLFETLRPADNAAPCNVGHINVELDYVRRYYIEFSYMDLDQKHTTTKRIYDSLVAQRLPNPIETKHPSKNWKHIWSNISNAFLPTRVCASWYDVVNATIPTAEKLHRIHLKATPYCERCHLVESVEHLLICEQKIQIWNWTRKKLALINRTVESTIQLKDVIFPDWNLYPRSKQNSYIWLMGHFVHFSIATKSPSLQDFLFYISKEHHKMQTYSKYKTTFQNFLTIALS